MENIIETLPIVIENCLRNEIVIIGFTRKRMIIGFVYFGKLKRITPFHGILVKDKRLEKLAKNLELPVVNHFGKINK